MSDPPDEMLLECGERLGPITLAYETYGTLNAEKNNAVLILHALSGDAHVAGYNSTEDKKPGWWDAMVGPGKCFDTDRYFVLCSNTIGSCKGSTGPTSFLNVRQSRKAGKRLRRSPVLTKQKFSSGPTWPI